ncbi:ROK family protein [Bacteroidota bacterium]
MKEVAIGIDIGGTNTSFGIVDREGNTLVEDSIKTNGNGNIEEYLKNLSQDLKNRISSLNEEVDIKGIGVGAPNGNYYNGTIEHAPNLVWKGIIPFVEMFQKHFPDIPITLTNDANAAAIGEMVYGAAKDIKNFITITLGTGLGGGVVANGRLIYGHDGFAGELGHIIIKRKGRKCGCGRRGCLETYVSATGIKRTVMELLSNETVDSDLRRVNFEDLNGKMITKAAEKGDKIALKAYEITGEILGYALADLMAILSPEVIYLFGGLAKAGDFLFEPVRKNFDKYVLPIMKNKIKIVPSGLQGKNVAVLGASALVWRELKKKEEASILK